MKDYESRVFSINDFREWRDNKQLQLNPKFQRRSVWKPKAKSFLMDTVVRGKPIPKIFLMQTINAQTRKSIREVVDGQQRLKTILSFIDDEFTISKRDNPTHGGLYFSQLDTDTQNLILAYDISVDILVNMPDSEILDIFSRLNSYSVILNDQEKLHAKYLGDFKVLSNKIGHSFNVFWTDNKILSDQEILRMGDASITADLLIAMIEGIKSKKQIKIYYEQYENEFKYDIDVLEDQFTSTIDLIQKIFPSGIQSTEFSRPQLFYSLFTTIYHLRYGLKGFAQPKIKNWESEYGKISYKLDRVNLIFDATDIKQLDKPEIQFLDDSRRATTDQPVRERRTNYLVDLILRTDADN